MSERSSLQFTVEKKPDPGIPNYISQEQVYKAVLNYLSRNPVSQELIEQAVSVYLSEHPVKTIVDSQLSETSENPVQNKIITKKFNDVIKDGTVVSENADFAEVGEWADGNPDAEDRTGYFVSVDTSEPGKTMVKATSASDVRGVAISQPAFAANASADKYDAEGNLLPQYNYVCFAGFAPVIDNGTCAVNGRCMPADDGTAVPSSNSMGYQVIERIDDTHVLLLVEPQADMMARIKEDVSQLSEDETLSLIIEEDILPAVYNSDGAILTDQNGNIVLRY